MSEDKVHKIIRKFTVEVTQEFTTDCYSSPADLLGDMNPLRYWDFKTTEVKPIGGVDIKVVNTTDLDDSIKLEVTLNSPGTTVTDLYKGWLRI